MPCCAPRYGSVIVAAVDFLAGIVAGFVVLLRGQNSALILVCLTFPAMVLTLIGIILTASFIKKNVLLATVAFTLNLSLLFGCGVIILILLTQKQFRSYSYTPVIIAALVYTIVIQLHFSCVIHDFKSKRLYLGHRRFQYLDNQNCDTEA